MKAKDTNTFRFVVAEGDRFFSSRWRIWTNDRCDQLMIATSNSAYLSKVTIHFDSQERFCHFPINQDYKDKMSAQGLIPPRHKDEVQWFRTPTPPIGSIPVGLCKILLLYNPNYSNREDSTKDLLRLSVPGIGKAWVIKTFVTLDDPILPPEGHQLCATFHLATKENVIVVTKVIDFDLAAFLQRHQALKSDGTVFSPGKDRAEFLGKPSLIHFWNDPRQETDNIFRIHEIGGPVPRAVR